MAPRCGYSVDTPWVCPDDVYMGTGYTLQAPCGSRPETFTATPGVPVEPHGGGAGGSPSNLNPLRARGISAVRKE